MKGSEGGLDSTYIEFNAEFLQKLDPVLLTGKTGVGGAVRAVVHAVALLQKYSDKYLLGYESPPTGIG